jgi:hypothetical protein
MPRVTITHRGETAIATCTTCRASWEIGWASCKGPGHNGKHAAEDQVARWGQNHRFSCTKPY